ncbi:hypothetical protein ACO0QE_004717 [Hanseniaspora vineae]
MLKSNNSTAALSGKSDSHKSSTSNTTSRAVSINGINSSTSTLSTKNSSSKSLLHPHVPGKHSKKKKYEDYSEDWSATVDDYSVPGKDNDFLINEVRNSTQLSRTNSQGNLAKILSTTSSSTGNQHSRTKILTEDEEINYSLERENEKELQKLNSKLSKIARFDDILKTPNNTINLSELRKVSWNGVPVSHRPLVWKLLIGYLPANKRRHEMLLKRKRNEYQMGIEHMLSGQHQRDQPTWHQIEIDIPRTNPHIKLYQYKSVQDSLQKILYYWAIRHPASGYVQGINDLVTPFFQTFLTEYLPEKKLDMVEVLDPQEYLTQEQFVQVEADSFWCLTKFLDTIIDNYIHGQPAILKQVSNLESLCKRIDVDLYQHLQKENVQFLQFAFRWMNCLLMRELPMSIVIRMWDTYLAETSSDEDLEDETLSPNMESLNISTMGGNTSSLFDSSLRGSTGQSKKSDSVSTNSAASSSMKRRTSLSEFHVFVCAAFLENWANVLLQMDFQGIITFLQNVPTTTWEEKEIEILLSEAFMWQTLYKDATSHWL